MNSTKSYTASSNNTKEFECPICLELIIGCAILPCGHLACVYCVHKGMGVESSNCFSCRKKYRALPALSLSLSLLILVHFREQFEERIEREKKASLSLVEQQADKESLYRDDEYEKFLKPFIDFLYKELKMLEQKTITTTTTTDYLVKCTKCDKLLIEPVAPSCGHLYCTSCAKNVKRCIAHGCYGGGVEKENLGVVIALKNLVGQLYPLEIEERIRAEREITNAETNNIMKQEEVDEEEEEAKTEAVDAAGGEKENIHFGIGCDLCGAYPIIGERYQCLDCKEDIDCPLGFDLCGQCKEFDDDNQQETAADGAFRFLQKHTKEHRLIKFPFQESILHRLKAANPQMSIEQILRIISIGNEEQRMEEEEDEHDEENVEEEEEEEETH